MIIKIKLNRIFPNPFQPEGRLNVSEETARQFGESILQHGLILTPVARENPASGANTYQLGDGWLRVSGFKWLVDNGHPEFDEIPLDVRDLTDQQLADMVIEANEVRKNLTPIDKACFYKECLAKLKITQAELAERYKITQGTLSNTIRLLDLPKPVQSKIISQEISMTHALILVPLKDWPGLLEGLVQKVIAESISTAALTDEVNQILNRQKKSKKVEPPPCDPPAPVAPLGDRVVADVKEAIAQGQAAEPTENKPASSTEVKPAPSPKPEPPKLNKIPVASKWKRKMSIEELASGVRVSLMCEKGLVVKNLEGRMETIMEQLPSVLEEANNKWEGK